MNEFPMDVLMYVLIFAALVLFNFAGRWIARWRAWLEQQMQQTHRTAQKVLDERATSPIRQTRRTVASARPTPGAATVASTAMARRLPETRALLTGRRNLQRAIIGMTVLGRCRAEQPD